MSKFNKFVNSPDLFFKDLIKKHISNQNLMDLKPVSNSNPKEKTITTVKNKVVNQVNKIAEPNLIFTMLSNSDKTVSIIHCGEGNSVGFPICEQWLKLTYSFRVNFTFLIRDLALYKALIAKYPTRNIVYAKTPIDIENLLSKFKYLKNLCFISNTANNIHLIRFNEYKHIYIGNFDPYRKSNNHKFFRAYDEIWKYSNREKSNFIHSFDNRHLDVKVVGNPFNEFFEIKTSNLKNKIYFNVKEGNSFSESFLIYIYDILNFIENKKIISTFNVSNKKIKNDFQALLSENYRMSSLGDCETSLIGSFYNLIVCEYENDIELEKLFLTNLPILCFNDENNSVSHLLKNSKFYSSLYKFSSFQEFVEILENLMNGIDPLLETREQTLLNDFGLSRSSKSEFDEFLNSISIHN